MGNVADLFEYHLANSIHDGCEFIQAGAEIVNVSWPLPTLQRESRRSRLIEIFFDRALIDDFEEASEDRQEKMAESLRMAIKPKLGGYDPEDTDNLPFRIALGTGDAEV
jgi:hypothetical protein